jgi:hypothetical protein
MLIKDKQFKKIEVFTKSEQYLGRLSGFELQTDNSKINNYYVKTKILLAGIFEKQLIINNDQIISFDDQKMIVEDNVLKEKIESEELLPKVETIEGTEPLITSKQS